MIDQGFWLGEFNLEKGRLFSRFNFYATGRKCELNVNSVSILDVGVRDVEMFGQVFRATLCNGEINWKFSYIEFVTWKSFYINRKLGNYENYVNFFRSCSMVLFYDCVTIGCFE